MKTQNQIIIEAIRKKIEREKEIELFIIKLKRSVENGKLFKM